ncbi:MAG: tRNA lysidine(34) synthetase TilS [Saprospiraceae bacterium]
MKEKLTKYISDHYLLDQVDSVLVAVSGGVDSMVLCFLLNELNIKFGIAHCNFQLRAEESDEDELFIKNLASKINVPYYSVHFETERLAKEQKKSIQVMARELRYTWLFELLEKEKFNKIATAHHLDDNIETVIYNFTKGTGIRGMRGILPIKNNLIRPLLFATKKEILTFAVENSIPFREDSSNNSDKYSRNKIRQQVVPVLELINPAFQYSAGESIQHLKDVEVLYNFAIEKISKELLKYKIDEKGDFVELIIDIDKLKKSPAPTTVLFEIIKQYGFNSTNANQIIQSLNNQAGSLFVADNYKILVDREYLIVEKNRNINQTTQVDQNSIGQNISIEGGQLTFSILSPPPTIFPKNKNIAFFDLSKIQWPITIRHWKEGDDFRPLGMKGRRKKLQDLFSDQKLTRLEKEKVCIMENNGEICWVIGIRPDERFKVTSETLHCWVVEFLPSIFAMGK